MKSPLSIRQLLSLVLFIALPAFLAGQSNQPDNGFVPEVGQDGKDVIWVPTPQELVDTMLAIAKVTADDFVIDLGSGDGRTVITAAKKGAKAIGIEYNPEMVSLSKKNAEKEGVSKRTEFIEADLFEYDFSKATVITMFLLPEINLKLRPRLLELKPGTRIVSNTFTMGEWEPDYEVETEDNWNSWNTALMWIVPAKVDGSWMMGTDELNIRQVYQILHGNLKSGGKSLLIDGRMNGNEISFKVNDTLYTGNVEGNKITGTVNSKGRVSSWSASR